MNVPGAAERSLPAPRLARAITVFALCWYGVVCVLNIRYATEDLWRTAGAAALVVVLFGIQLTHTLPTARAWPPRRRYLTLGVQAVLTYLPFLLYGLNWGSMAGPLAASVLLMLPHRAGWTLFGVIVATTLAISMVTTDNEFMIAYFTGSTVLAAIVIWGMTRLAELVSEVHASRRQVARMAVTQERLRFSRDLHDLLGYSLSSITLKSELTYRLIATRPNRAREEVGEVLKISRRALADARLVAHGYREMSLVEEGDSAAEILAAADIEADLRLDCGQLHPMVDTVMATVLREGVTNILRHSKAQHCTVTAKVDGGTVELTLVNDGVDRRPSAVPRSGRHADERSTGLQNLRERLTAVKGELTAEVREDGRYRLTATAPLVPPAAQGEEAGGAPEAFVA